MIHKNYELISPLPVHVALQRIGDLLTKERVKFKISNSSIISLKTPFALFGVDPRRYSHNNWVGLNPFAYVSGIQVQCLSNGNGLTRVIIRVDRFRAFVWVAWCVACSSLAASAMPLPGGIILGVGFPWAAWLYIVSFLGGYLIKKEISDNLKDGNHPQGKT